MAKSNRGLTLIEVLIAITLLTVISLFVYQASSRSFEVNRNLSAESISYESITVSIETMERDIAQMFSPVLPDIDKSAAANNPQNTQTNLGQPSQFWSAVLSPDGMRRSRFQGTRDKISFISNGNQRVQKDSKESDFLKVTWEIEKNKDNAYSLTRRTDIDAFNYNDNSNPQKSEKVTLLDNLSSGKFTFYRADRGVWEDSWDSESNFAKAETRFPALVSLKIEMPDPINPAIMTPWEGIFKTNININTGRPPEPKDASK